MTQILYKSQVSEETTEEVIEESVRRATVSEETTEEVIEEPV